MRQYAEDIIDGTCDFSRDYTYNNYRVRSHSSKDTPAEANIRAVRVELAILIKEKIDFLF